MAVLKKTNDLLEALKIGKEEGIRQQKGLQIAGSSKRDPLDELRRGLIDQSTFDALKITSPELFRDGDDDDDDGFADWYLDKAKKPVRERPAENPPPGPGHPDYTPPPSFPGQDIPGKPPVKLAHGKHHEGWTTEDGQFFSPSGTHPPNDPSHFPVDDNNNPIDPKDLPSGDTGLTISGGSGLTQAEKMPYIKEWQRHWNKNDPYTIKDKHRLKFIQDLVLFDRV